MSGITVKIVASSNSHVASAVASGSLSHVITDTERRSFTIGGDQDLKRAVGRYFEREPNDAYLKSPTPWGDLYKRYGWQQATTILVPRRAEVLGVSSKPTIIAKKTLKNQSNKKATFSTQISEQVANTVSNSWSESTRISFDQSIKYEVGFLGTGGGGETKFGFQQEFGLSHTKSQTTTVGTTTGISVDLNPGEEVIVELNASSGRMKVRITYDAYLTGATAVNYNPKHKGHHFWALDVGAVIGGANKIQVVEDMEIGFYSDAHAKIRNRSGSEREDVLLAHAGDEEVDAVDD